MSYGGYEQNGNRYLVNKGAITSFTYGFKSIKQFEEWITTKKSQIEWRVKYAWKFYNNDMMRLVDKMGKEPKGIHLTKQR